MCPQAQINEMHWIEYHSFLHASQYIVRRYILNADEKIDSREIKHNLYGHKKIIYPYTILTGAKHAWICAMWKSQYVSILTHHFSDVT